MNIMNILYTFYSGGVERLAIDVSNKLAEKGNNTYLCIISDKYDEKLIEQVSLDVNICLLKREKKNRKLSYLKQIIQIIDKNKIDVIHVHQGTLMPFYFLVKILRPKVKYYITIHDTYIFTQLSKKNQYLCRIVCRKLISISDAVTEDIVKNGIKRSKIYRVYNGVNFSNYPLIKRDRKNLDKIKIVNVARFFPEKKGQDILIKAIALIKKQGYNVEIIFAGGEINDNSNEIEKMKKLADKLNIADNAKFLGNVTDVMSVLKQGDIFCIPSRYEGFGISAVEAMGTGLPCVASNIDGLNEVVNNPMLGQLFENGNEIDLASSLIYVYKHIIEYSPQKISSNVRNRFSIENMVEELIRIYQE